MYIGYCVQFLHQCQLSVSLPLTYSTIQITLFVAIIITIDFLGRATCEFLQSKEVNG